MAAALPARRSIKESIPSVVFDDVYLEDLEALSDLFDQMYEQVLDEDLFLIIAINQNNVILKRRVNSLARRIILMPHGGPTQEVEVSFKEDILMALRQSFNFTLDPKHYVVP